MATERRVRHVGRSGLSSQVWIVDDLLGQSPLPKTLRANHRSHLTSRKNSIAQSSVNERADHISLIEIVRKPELDFARFVQ